MKPWRRLASSLPSSPAWMHGAVDPAHVKPAWLARPQYGRARAGSDENSAEAAMDAAGGQGHGRATGHDALLDLVSGRLLSGDVNGGVVVSPTPSVSPRAIHAFRWRHHLGRTAAKSRLDLAAGEQRRGTRCRRDVGSRRQRRWAPRATRCKARLVEGVATSPVGLETSPSSWSNYSAGSARWPALSPGGSPRRGGRGVQGVIEWENLARTRDGGSPPAGGPLPRFTQASLRRSARLALDSIGSGSRT